AAHCLRTSSPSGWQFAVPLAVSASGPLAVMAVPLIRLTPKGDSTERNGVLTWSTVQSGVPVTLLSTAHLTANFGSLPWPALRTTSTLQTGCPAHVPVAHLPTWQFAKHTVSSGWFSESGHFPGGSSSRDASPHLASFWHVVDGT